MNSQLTYLLQVNIGLLLFYGCYRLFFVRDTFWNTHRICLLLSIAIPVVAPLVPFDLFSAYYPKATDINLVKEVAALPEVVATAATSQQYKSAINPVTLIGVIYVVATGFFLVRFATRLASILRFRLQGVKTKLMGISVIRMQKEAAPFSFFGLIFLNPDLYSPLETRQILEHEQAHSRQWHSLDILIAEIASCLFWFNPAIWLLKREIRNNHEFLADQEVLHAGIDVKDYQYHLLRATYSIPEGSLGNQFNVSPLKKRIMMMNRKKSAQIACLKYMLIAPLSLALAFVASAQAIEKNVPAIDGMIDLPQVNLASLPVEKPATSSKVDPLKVSEPQEATKPVEVQKVAKQEDPTQPQYPGGEAKLMEYIARNIKYPVEAAENGIQGIVVIRFEVTESGKITNAKVFSSNFKVWSKSENGTGTTAETEKDKQGQGIRLDEVVVSAYQGGKKLATTRNPNMTALENEALRLVNNMEDWIPARKDGKAISATYTLPIKYRLQ
jgi:BlaR1 peptidase M56/Gram-negative bacterial TonB protein C-terminal